MQKGVLTAWTMCSHRLNERQLALQQRLQPNLLGGAGTAPLACVPVVEPWVRRSAAAGAALCCPTTASSPARIDSFGCPKAVSSLTLRIAAIEHSAQRQGQGLPRLGAAALLPALKQWRRS